MFVGSCWFINAIVYKHIYHKPYLTYVAKNQLSSKGAQLVDKTMPLCTSKGCIIHQSKNMPWDSAHPSANKLCLCQTGKPASGDTAVVPILDWP